MEKTKKKGRIEIGMTMTEYVAMELTKLRAKTPLVHFITNYVTANDVANAVLAIGASPVMADAIEEAADMTSIASALVLNMGTLNHRTVAAMLAAGKRANERHIPVVLDPVGAGASAFRTETVKKLLAELRVSVLRGNLSELSCVSGLNVATKGVDVSAEDAENDARAIAKSLADRFGFVAAITGSMDVISDGQRTICIQNGHKEMTKVTGTGCMASGLVGAFAGAGAGMLTAAAAGVAAMGIAGEAAYEKIGETGTGSFHIALLDALSRLDAGMFLERARIYEA